MSFFKDLKEDIAQSVNELTESLDENLTVDDEKTKETVPMSELTTDFPPEEPTEEVPELVVENSETEENEIAVAAEPEEVIEEPVEAPVEEVVDEPEEIEEPVEDYEEEDVMNEEVMEEAMEEAQRCLGCKKPKCVEGCPVSINIPGFIEEIKEGKIEEAYKVIGLSSALPAICGRVCPQESQCEWKCIRGITGAAVSIGKLARFVADYALAHDFRFLSYGDSSLLIP